MLPYLEHLQATDPSYVTMTTPLSSKIGENFYEGMKWMYARMLEKLAL